MPAAEWSGKQEYERPDGPRYPFGRPSSCRAPARRVHGRRVRYVIGSEPGQVNGMRWRTSEAL
ncbi:tryptophan biosynthesis modulator TrpM [Streptomyces goshikiensis]